MESLSVTLQTYKAMSFTLRFGKATTASNRGYLARPFCRNASLFRSEILRFCGDAQSASCLFVCSLVHDTRIRTSRSF